MATSRSALYLGLLSVLAGGTAWALIPGGHLDHADCLAEWRVTSRALGPSRGARRRWGSERLVHVRRLHLHVADRSPDPGMRATRGADRHPERERAAHSAVHDVAGRLWPRDSAHRAASGLPAQKNRGGGILRTPDRLRAASVEARAAQDDRHGAWHARCEPARPPLRAVVGLHPAELPAELERANSAERARARHRGVRQRPRPRVDGPRPQRARPPDPRARVSRRLRCGDDPLV